MVAFVLGVLSSILATMILVLVGWMRSSRPRWWLVALLARLTGTGVHRVYRRQSSAEKDVARDLARARWVRVLTGRGNTLTRDVFTPLWSDTTGRVESVRVLLPDPDAVPGEWLALRAAELEPIDPGFTPDLLRNQIRANTSYLSSVAKGREGIELRRFDLPHLYRVIVTDQAAYITFYDRGRHGRHSPCLYVRAPGVLYEAALHFFSTTWAGSQAVPTEQSPDTGAPNS
ncbi:hypothetical protein [Nocardiopsis listeri]|uniref:hypothetical protein n=1 Tax=Nocardiopsis listeri TaxID=53440 RepID=UPI00082B363C|nr:hypothetical protein [Nocardiopsis listeri]